ncbi:MAG: hypothetical protein IKB34_06725 [Clostridia bacterium]|nr:hypothetical protein [Clostridia bacterium]
MRKATAKPNSANIAAPKHASSDLRGTAYVNGAEKPFRTNGVSSTAVTGGDLRVRGGERK